MTTTQQGTRPATAPRHFPAQSVYEAAAAELMEMLERAPDRVFVVDIQDPEVFHEGHIPGARNIHLEDLVSACSELPKDRTVVIYCGDVSCGLPLWAALELAQLGFCAKYLQGGLAEWSRRDFPVEISPPPPPPEY
jgi:rhodanese-related sulfurtransferase